MDPPPNPKPVAEEKAAETPPVPPAAEEKTAEKPPEPAAEKKDMPPPEATAEESQDAPATATSPEKTATTVPQYVESPTDAENLGPKNKEFMKVFAAYQAITKQLHEWTIEYQDAKPQRQLEIDKLHREKYAEGQKMVKEMIDTALDAFDEAPNRNPWVTIWLCSLVEWEYRRDNYEPSVRIFKRIAAKGVPEEAALIYVFAGLSAMMTADLDEAEAWITIAQENGALERYFESFPKTQKGMNDAMSIGMILENLPLLKENWAKEKEIRKAEAEVGEKDAAKKLPRVLLKTSKGDITLELFENEAPNTVANFISLVEKKFYDGVIFHRVLPRFMAQGGDPDGDGRGGPGYRIDCECHKPDYRKHFRGSLSMAHAGLNTGGSQFFLTFVPTTMLDGRHTVFGRVVEGFEVLAEIQRVDPEDKDAFPAEDKIIEAKVLDKRDHAYEPKKN